MFEDLDREMERTHLLCLRIEGALHQLGFDYCPLEGDELEAVENMKRADELFGPPKCKMQMIYA